MSDRKAVKSSPGAARLVRALLASAGALPLSWSRAFGGVLGGLLAHSPNEQRAITELNLELCFPDASVSERRRLACASLRQTGMAALELGAMWRWPVARLAALEEDSIGEELLHESLESGAGTLLLTPHLGQWEFLNHYLMRRAQLVCLYRPPRIAELEKLMLTARGRTGCISTPATRGGVRRVLRALRGGELVLILPDQEPLKALGVSAPFFGVPALTMTLIQRILQRTGARALFVFAERRPAGKFRVRFLEAPAGLDDDDAMCAATALNSGVEACVRRIPEQYLWSYKRFKTAPPGETTPYRAIWNRKRRRQSRQASLGEASASQQG